MSNVIWEEILQGLIETLQMTVVSAVLAYIIGMPLGVLLVVTDKGHILQNRVINLVFGTIVNIFRSIPFLILLVFLIPFTRWLTGASTGTVATTDTSCHGRISKYRRQINGTSQQEGRYCFGDEKTQ